MTKPSVVLQRLSGVEAALIAMCNGAFGVFPKGDRRRRPIARIDAAGVRALVSSGLVVADGDRFVITAAGRAKLRRDAAPELEERFLHQHGPVQERATIDPDGVMRNLRAVESGGALKRLKALRAGDGSPWLCLDELAAAARLQEDWLLGQAGLIGGSDWRAPPRGGAARGPGAGREGALAAHCDARARVAEALSSLAPPLRRVVERVCLREEGLEALERAENWPARSGKIALKLGLAQLAQARR